VTLSLEFRPLFQKMFCFRYTDRRGILRYAINEPDNQNIRQLVRVAVEPNAEDNLDIFLGTMSELNVGDILPNDDVAGYVVQVLVLKMSYFLTGRIVHMKGLGDLFYIQDRNIPDFYSSVFTDSRLERRGFSLAREHRLLTLYLAKFRIVNETRRQLSQLKGKHEAVITHVEVHEEILEQIIQQYRPVRGTTITSWSTATVDRIMLERDSVQHEVPVEDNVYEIITVAPIKILTDIFCESMIWTPAYRERGGDLLEAGGRTYAVVEDPSSPYHERPHAMRIKIFKASRTLKLHFYLLYSRCQEDVEGFFDPNLHRSRGRQTVS
jgi:hypothetical protein